MKKRFRLFITLIFCLTLFSPDSSLSQTENLAIQAKTQVDKNNLTVGDIVKYSIVVKKDPSIKTLVSDPKPHFNAFIFLDQGIETKNKDSWTKETHWYQFRADKVGHHTIPEIEIEFFEGNSGDKAKRILAPKIAIVINSVLYRDGDPKEIRDIKPIIGAGPDWERYIVYGLIAIIVATLIFYGLSRIKKKKPRRLQPERNKLLPHEEAFQKINRLVAKKLIAENRHQEHYFELSEIFRCYLGKTLHIPALDWTKEEIIHHLDRNPDVSALMRDQTVKILYDTDQVKFARAGVNDTESKRHLNEIQEFIQLGTTKEKSQLQSSDAEA